jgi:hypothetical protein
MGRPKLGKKKITWTLYPATITKVQAMAKSRGMTTSDFVDEVINNLAAVDRAGVAGWRGFIGEPVRAFTAVEKKIFPMVYRAFMQKNLADLKALEGFKEQRLLIAREFEKLNIQPFDIADPFVFAWCSFLSRTGELARVWAFTLCHLRSQKGSALTFQDWIDSFVKGVPEREDVESNLLSFMDNPRNWPSIYRK